MADQTINVQTWPQYVKHAMLAKATFLLLSGCHLVRLGPGVSLEGAKERVNSLLLEKDDLQKGDDSLVEIYSKERK